MQQAIAREKVIIKQIQKSTPVVQSYIQDLRPDVKLYQVPVSDQYMIGRVDFGKAFTADEYAQAERGGKAHGWFGGSFKFMSELTKAFHLENSPTGFMAMMFIDPSGFDQQHYQFTFVRREFLGTVRTWVFDVRPRGKGSGPVLRTHLGGGRRRERLFASTERTSAIRTTRRTTISISTAGG